MFIDSFGRVVSCYDGSPQMIGRHWVYCCYGTSYGKLYSFDGMHWYKFGVDEQIKIEQSKINAFPCSVWEMLRTKNLYNDVDFVKRFKCCIVLSDFIEAGIKEEYLLEGLLS